MHIFITGGAGFIGCNSADYFLQQGQTVTIFDNLSRKGGRSNLAWLQELHPGRFTFIEGDIRQFDAVAAAIQQTQPQAVLHLAGQVAVTTSVVNPREDFEINALGTFNVLEAVRQHAPTAAFIFASTNKVYGGMEELVIDQHPTRYAYRDYPAGIPETYPLDFHSPYGCSKGAGDQYTIDYGRIYGLNTVAFRQSCIYGPRQFGVEDQGWVAHFVIATVLKRPISIYGDGYQVRDLLHVRDLVRAYELAIHNMDKVRGKALNVGGGPTNTLSIWKEFGPLLENLHGHPIPVTHGEWRPGDQQVFVADIALAEKLLGWRPEISVTQGVQELYNWVAGNPHLFG